MAWRRKEKKEKEVLHMPQADLTSSSVSIQACSSSDAPEVPARLRSKELSQDSDGCCSSESSRTAWALEQEQNWFGDLKSVPDCSAQALKKFLNSSKRVETISRKKLSNLGKQDLALNQSLTKSEQRLATLQRLLASSENHLGRLSNSAGTSMTSGASPTQSPKASKTTEKSPTNILINTMQTSPGKSGEKLSRDTTTRFLRPVLPGESGSRDQELPELGYSMEEELMLPVQPQVTSGSSDESIVPYGEGLCINEIDLDRVGAFVYRRGNLAEVTRLNRKGVILSSVGFLISSIFVFADLINLLSCTTVIDLVRGLLYTFVLVVAILVFWYWYKWSGRVYHPFHKHSSLYKHHNGKDKYVNAKPGDFVVHVGPAQGLHMVDHALVAPDRRETDEPILATLSLRHIDFWYVDKPTPTNVPCLQSVFDSLFGRRNCIREMHVEWPVNETAVAVITSNKHTTLANKTYTEALASLNLYVDSQTDVPMPVSESFPHISIAKASVLVALWSMNMFHTIQGEDCGARCF